MIPHNGNKQMEINPFIGNVAGMPSRRIACTVKNHLVVRFGMHICPSTGIKAIFFNNLEELSMMPKNVSLKKELNLSRIVYQDFIVFFLPINQPMLG